MTVKTCGLVLGVCVVRAFVWCACGVWCVCCARACVLSVWERARVRCVVCCARACAPKDDPFGKLETILPMLFHSFVLSLFSCVALHFLLPLPFLLVSPLYCVLYNFFFYSENHAVYEIMWKKI